jgi:hypothetical protein
MNPPEDENSITIDPYGDRSLIIGDGKNQKRFLVSSNAMRLASPIWKSMFTGPYKEGTAKEIPFPEGKPDAFLITLQIAHLRFADLPSLLDFQGLVNLAIVCDEYDMVPTVCPFLAKWITPLEPLANKIGFEEWLFVAWTFGYPKIFEQLSRRLVLCARTNADGQCLNETMKVLDDCSMPPGIIGKLRTLYPRITYLGLTRALEQRAYFVHETPSSLIFSKSVIYISIGSSQAHRNIARLGRALRSVVL